MQRFAGLLARLQSTFFLMNSLNRHQNHSDQSEVKLETRSVKGFKVNQTSPKTGHCQSSIVTSKACLDVFDDAAPRSFSGSLCLVSMGVVIRPKRKQHIWVIPRHIKFNGVQFSGHHTVYAFVMTIIIASVFISLCCQDGVVFTLGDCGIVGDTIFYVVFERRIIKVARRFESTILQLD